MISRDSEALVLTVFQTSRETRIASLKMRLVSSHETLVSQEGGNLHLSGTVVTEVVNGLSSLLIIIITVYSDSISTDYTFCARLNFREHHAVKENSLKEKKFCSSTVQ